MDRGYRTEIVRVSDLVTRADDYMSVSVRSKLAPESRTGLKFDAQLGMPAGLLQLHKESERTRRRVLESRRPWPSAQRRAFVERMQERMLKELRLVPVEAPAVVGESSSEIIATSSGAWK